MTSNRFYIEKPKADSSPYIFLYGDQHHHLSRVVRIKPKEKVWLFDGQGTSYLARVEEIGKQRTRLFILRAIIQERPPLKITLAQALLRSKKMEFLIQKGTEWGVSAFAPVVSERSIVKIHESKEVRQKRWQRIAREASKQSGQSFFPEVLPSLPLVRFLREREEEKKLLLSENQGKALREILLQHKGDLPRSVAILVGPEGGWSEKEERDILDCGFEAVTLGRQILRAETAALSSVALISHFWNR